MRLTDAVKSLQLGKKKIREKKKLRTVWSPEQWEADACPLPEYPRPQLVRDHWINLNGWWEYQIVKAGGRFSRPDGRILVPFSPETDASGVNRVLQPGEGLWSRCYFECPETENGHRVLLHFGAVDERCAVFINGPTAGKHRNGYLSFSFDITELVRPGENELRVYVRDDSDTGMECRGKQRLSPGGMFYQAQSGIWQTVWMETVPENHITDLQIIPLDDLRTVRFRITLKDPAPVEINLGSTMYRMDECGFQKSKEAAVLETEITVHEPRLWSPESPALYEADIIAGKDHVQSYFAIRSFGTGTDENGHACLTLNGKPYFMNGVLDQGYWPESLMTAPSDEALLYDITEMKQAGFNMIRKHEKIEAERWYYHCDRLGMIVWQDMVHGGGRIDAMRMTYLPTVFPWIWTHLKDEGNYRLFGRTDAQARTRFEKDLLRMIRQLENHPCIGLWNIFNEGWGQFDALRLTEMVREADPARLIDHASGWFDQGGGDVKSVHNYFRKLVVEKDARPFVLSEYGGYTCDIPGHVMYEENYGYRDYSPEDLPDAFDELMAEIEALKKDGLAAAVYTQISDIEEEKNGILTYDRKVKKAGKQE